MESARLWRLTPSAGIAFFGAATLVIAACSSTKGVPTEASVAAVMTEGTMGLCNNSANQPFLPTISDGGVSSLVPNGSPVADPISGADRAARVFCQVLHNPDGTYTFTASASLNLSWGLTFAGANLAATTGQAGSATVSASFTPAGLQTNPVTFTSNTCTLSWASNLGFIPGGVGGTLNCPDLIAGEGLKIQGADGGYVAVECAGRANFAFEGCAQN